MSLLTLVAVAAAATTLAPATTNLDHRGTTYRVDYHPRIDVRSRAIGIAPPTRPSSQRCMVTTTVSVERVIADGGHELKAALPGTRSFTDHLPGSCNNAESRLASSNKGRSEAIKAHLAQTAAADRAEAIAAIDAAHHFAAN